MSATLSPSTNRAYGVLRVAQEWSIARSTFYARRKEREKPLGKRGPRVAPSDEQLLEAIVRVLAASVFSGEGYRKVWAKLRFEGIRTSKERVRRLMGEKKLLVPPRAKRRLGPRSHEGTITTPLPDQMWGSDLTSTQTIQEGQAGVFVAIDHCTSECVGIHAAARATRFEALEPIRQGVRERFGVFAQSIAAGLKLRHDQGSQYVSRYFQEEVRFLGIESSASFVRSPEGNGCAE